ncbi:hypothetical protein [Nonomuraea jiangxiensis]|uniref:hypothetical protein n=1 Tax=Nonomuraea jiangxiensis TaxID=633440 RepID=UPI000B83C2F6|nr:hypothetical protein [Nonomuraea jiangxiensis]
MAEHRPTLHALTEAVSTQVGTETALLHRIETELLEPIADLEEQAEGERAAATQGRAAGQGRPGGCENGGGTREGGRRAGRCRRERCGPGASGRLTAMACHGQVLMTPVIRMPASGKIATIGRYAPSGRFEVVLR